MNQVTPASNTCLDSSPRVTGGAPPTPTTVHTVNTDYSTPLPTQTSLLDNQPWGHTASQAQADCICFVYQNVNGIPYHNMPSSAQHIAVQFKSLNPNVLSLADPKLNWIQYLSLCQQFSYNNSKHTSHCQLLTSQCKLPTHLPHLPGGIASLTFSRLTGHISSTYTNLLGRWTNTMFSHPVTGVSQNHLLQASPTTAYCQQYSALLQMGHTAPEPKQ